MSHTFYSQRKGSNPNLSGLPLSEIIDLFSRVYDQFRQDGFFDESFGFDCTDLGHMNGLVRDVELEMLLSIRKRNLW
jgi:hypothetical protein